MCVSSISIAHYFLIRECAARPQVVSQVIKLTSREPNFFFAARFPAARAHLFLHYTRSKLTSLQRGIRFFFWPYIFSSRLSLGPSEWVRCQKQSVVVQQQNSSLALAGRGRLTSWFTGHGSMILYKFSFKTFLADGKASKVVDVVLPRRHGFTHSLTLVCVMQKLPNVCATCFAAFIGAIRTHTIKADYAAAEIAPPLCLVLVCNSFLKCHKTGD